MNTPTYGPDLALHTDPVTAARCPYCYPEIAAQRESARKEHEDKARQAARRMDGVVYYTGSIPPEAVTFGAYVSSGGGGGGGHGRALALQQHALLMAKPEE